MTSLNERRSRTEAFWKRWESRLRSYADDWSPSESRLFKHREGWFVLVRTVVLIGLAFLAIYCPLVAAPISAYFIADALVVNTALVFTSGAAPISVLRSGLLTILAYLDLALGFAVGWVWLRKEHQEPAWERVITAVYESIRTLATVGPETLPGSSVGRLLVITELFVGVYFVVIVLAIYASWARTGGRGSA